MILIYTPCKDKEEAEKIAKELISKKCVACTNIFPITSCYEWQGRIDNDNEIVLLAKTTKAKANSAVKEIKKLHSYDVPCIMKMSAEVNKEYKEWMEEQLS